MKFSRKAVLELRAMRAQIDRMLSQYGAPVPSAGDEPVSYLVKTPAEGLGAGDPAAPVKTVCTISRRGGSADPRAIEHTDRKINVYNRGAFVPPGVVLDAYRDPWGDYYAAIGGVCTMLVRAPLGGIPARADEVMGVETCTALVQVGGSLYLTDYEVDVYNWLTTEVMALGDRLGRVEFADGIWWAMADDCNDTSTTTFPTFGG